MSRHVLWPCVQGGRKPLDINYRDDECNILTSSPAVLGLPPVQLWLQSELVNHCGSWHIILFTGCDYARGNCDPQVPFSRSPLGRWGRTTLYKNLTWSGGFWEGFLEEEVRTRESIYCMHHTRYFASSDLNHSKILNIYPCADEWFSLTLSHSLCLRP